MTPAFRRCILGAMWRVMAFLICGMLASCGGHEGSAKCYSSSTTTSQAQRTAWLELSVDRTFDFIDQANYVNQAIREATRENRFKGLWSGVPGRGVVLVVSEWSVDGKERELPYSYEVELRSVPGTGALRHHLDPDTPSYPGATEREKGMLNALLLVHDILAPAACDRSSR